MLTHLLGTYVVTFTYPDAGSYELDVQFMGTFMGKAGHLRGAPYKVNVEATGDALMNELNGPLVMEYIRKQTKEIKDYSTSALKSLKKNIPKEELDALIKVKEVINGSVSKGDAIELKLESCRNSLAYFKRKGGQMDKMIDQIEFTATSWEDVLKQVMSM
jgi:hypothetical protein